MSKSGSKRDEDQRAAWEDSYPHPLISCLMPGIAVLTVIAALLLCFHLWQLSLPPDTTVPMVEGLKMDDALAELKRAGLGAVIVNEQQASETVPQDSVISSNPDGGRHVKRGRIVRLVLSSGSAYTTVPDVRELPEATANERLTTANLMITKIDYAFHDTIPYGRVIRVTPKQGARVKKSMEVALVISKGPKVDETAGGTNGGLINSTTLTINLPTDGDPRAVVRIDVSDNDGERTVYTREHRAGELIVQSVQGNGNVTAKVYYGDRLIQTTNF